MQLFFATGASIISMFTEAVQCRFGAVGIHLAVSSISCGKSNCAKVAIAMAGNFPKGVVSHLTDSTARSYLSGALPFLYDNPTHDDVLKPLPMNSFGAEEMSTHRQKFSARCVPIVTCNERILEDLVKADQRYCTVMFRLLLELSCSLTCRFLARALLVPFAHHAPAASIDTLDEILREAPSALPQAIKVSLLSHVPTQYINSCR